MPTCPSCRARYPEGTSRCETDGAELLADPAIAGTADLASGAMVGEYRVEAKLGEGGFGSVYRASHPVIGKKAAIKVLRLEYSTNPDMVSRFVDEARAVNQIRHRNIVDIFAFGALDDGRQYFVMELLEGRTLHSLLREQVRLPVDVTLGLLRGIARALGAAHAAGIVHRDLKPENVLLVEDEDGNLHPKLLDFGIAKLLADHGTTQRTGTGTPIGTPAYMSPEQCEGTRIDHRTDVYALGIVAHECLTGARPFEGDSTLDLLVKQARAAPPRLSECARDLPAELDAPLLRMLAKDPEQRPAGALEAVRELEEAAQQAGVALPTPSRQGEAISASRLPRVVALTPAPTLGAPASGDAPTLAQATTTSVAGSTGAAPPRGLGSRSGALLAGAAMVAVVVWWLVGRAPSPPLDSSATVTAPEPSASAVVASPAAQNTQLPAAASSQPATMVRLTIQSEPANAEIFVGDERLGVAPGPIELEKGEAPVVLTLRAPGHEPGTVEVRPTESGTVRAKLAPTKRAAPRKGAPPRNRDLEF